MHYKPLLAQFACLFLSFLFLKPEGCNFPIRDLIVTFLLQLSQNPPTWSTILFKATVAGFRGKVDENERQLVFQAPFSFNTKNLPVHKHWCQNWSLEDQLLGSRKKY